MPKWDGLKPLPDHVIAPLLRTLACIPRTADTRLLLVKRTDGRPPGWDRENDYDVVFRGRKVGRIWKYDYTGKVSGEMARWLWHWDWRDVDGRKDAEGHCGSLEAAMAQFRAAWDAPAGNVRSTSNELAALRHCGLSQPASTCAASRQRAATAHGPRCKWRG